MIELTVLFILLPATGVAWLYARDIAYPPVVLGGIWSVTVFAYAAYVDAAYPLTEVTGAIVVFGFIAFLLGALVSAAPTRNGHIGPHKTTPLATSSGAWLLWVSMGGFPLFALKAWEIAATGPTNSFLVNLRLALTEEGAMNPLGGLAYLASIAIFGAAIHVLGLVRTTRARTVWFVALALAYSLLSSGRSHFLVLLALINGGLLISGRVRLRTVLLVGGVSFVTVFGGMAFLLGKGISGESEVLPQFGTAFIEYLLAGLAGLNDYLKETHSLEFGVNSLRTVVAVLARAGFEVAPRELIKEFRWVPFPTNVYTVHRAYFADFGWAGVAVSQMLFGAIHGSVYVRARAGSRVHAFLYGLLLYPLVMQVFQDQYFSLLSTWIQALILLALVRVTGRRARVEQGGTTYDSALPNGDAQKPQLSRASDLR